MDGTEAVKTEQQIAGLATEIAPSSKHTAKQQNWSSLVLEANETEWAEHVPASASSSSAAVCCPTGNGSREERRKKEGCRRSRMLIGSAAGDWRPWPKTCVALRHCRAERKLTASFSQGGGGGKIGDEKAALLRWCCAPEAPMEPRSTITTLAQARRPTTMQRRTRTPTTHALGHPNDPIKVRVAPLHPTSLLSYTSRCPPPAARDLRDPFLGIRNPSLLGMFT